MTASAYAGGRKRIVVLDFEGPKGEKFHDDIVKLIKKSHTVVSTSKWNGAAEEMGADTVNEKNIKKIARKLKVDGVITGKVEKRRDEYIVQIKLRAGTSGEMVGNRVDTKAEGPKLDGQASRDVKEELLPAIDGLDANHGGAGDDEDEDKPAKKAKKDEDEDKPAKKAKKDEDEDKPAKKAKKDEDEDEPKHGAFAKKDDDARGGDKVGRKSKKDEDEDKPAKKTKKDEDEDKPAKKTKKDDEDTAALSTKHDEDETPLPKSKKRASKKDDEDSGDDAPHKKVAKRDDDEDGGSADAESDDAEVDSAAALSPSERAIDATVGLSFVARSLSFKYAANLATPPPGYKQSIPVAGALLDVTGYPLAFGHKNKSLLRGLGISLLYDQVLKINSQKRYTDAMGQSAVANLATSESRFGIGAVFRYPLGTGAMAPVVGGKLGYISQSFTVAQTLPDNTATDIPNVSYSAINLGAMLRYPATPKIVLDADLGYLVITGAGAITTADQYGSGSASGFEGSAGADYLVTKNVFARGTVRFETIGFNFAGNGKLATMRDSDPTTVDVSGARDTYYGFALSVGYLY